MIGHTRREKRILLVGDLDEARPQLNAISKGVDPLTNDSGPGHLLVGVNRPQSIVPVRTKGGRTYVEPGVLVEPGTRFRFKGNREESQASGRSSTVAQVDDDHAGKGSSTIARGSGGEAAEGGETPANDAAPWSHLLRVVDGHLCILGNDPREHSSEDPANLVGGGFYACQGNGVMRRTRLGDALQPMRLGLSTGADFPAEAQKTMDQEEGLDDTIARDLLESSEEAVGKGDRKEDRKEDGRAAQDIQDRIDANDKEHRELVNRLVEVDYVDSAEREAIEERLSELGTETYDLYEELWVLEEELRALEDAPLAQQDDGAPGLGNPNVDPQGLTASGWQKLKPGDPDYIVGMGGQYRSPDGRVYTMDYRGGWLYAREGNTRIQVGKEDRVIHVGLWKDASQPMAGAVVQRPASAQDIEDMNQELSDLLSKQNKTAADIRRITLLKLRLEGKNVIHVGLLADKDPRSQIVQVDPASGKEYIVVSGGSKTLKAAVTATIDPDQPGILQRLHDRVRDQIAEVKAEILALKEQLGDA